MECAGGGQFDGGVGKVSRRFVGTGCAGPSIDHQAQRTADDAAEVAAFGRAAGRDDSSGLESAQSLQRVRDRLREPGDPKCPRRNGGSDLRSMRAASDCLDSIEAGKRTAHRRGVRYSRVIVSSRFRRTRARVVHVSASDSPEHFATTCSRRDRSFAVGLRERQSSKPRSMRAAFDF